MNVIPRGIRGITDNGIGMQHEMTKLVDGVLEVQNDAAVPRTYFPLTSLRLAVLIAAGSRGQERRVTGRVPSRRSRRGALVKVPDRCS